MVYKKLERFIEKKLHDKQLVYFSLFAIIAIPLSTYILATNGSPFQYTLSMIGNKLWHRMQFIIRWIIIGTMLSFYILRLYLLGSFKNKKARRLLSRWITSLILTVMIPATNNFPIGKQLHLITAIVFAICLMTSLYLFTTTLQDHNQKAYRRSIGLLYTIIWWSLIMLFVFGNTGMFELFFFTMLTIFLIFIRQKI